MQKHRIFAKSFIRWNSRQSARDSQSKMIQFLDDNVKTKNPRLSHVQSVYFSFRRDKTQLQQDLAIAIEKDSKIDIEEYNQLISEMETLDRDCVQPLLEKMLKRAKFRWFIMFTIISIVLLFTNFSCVFPISLHSLDKILNFDKFLQLSYNLISMITRKHKHTFLYHDFKLDGSQTIYIKE